MTTLNEQQQERLRAFQEAQILYIDWKASESLLRDETGRESATVAEARAVMERENAAAKARYDKALEASAAKLANARQESESRLAQVRDKVANDQQSYREYVQNARESLGIDLAASIEPAAPSGGRTRL